MNIKGILTAILAGGAVLLDASADQDGSEACLPAGYTALSFVESTGVQYIDTEYAHKAGDTFSCEFSSRLDRQSTGSSAIFGVMTAAGGPRCIFWARRDSSLAPVIQYGSDSSKTGTAGSYAYGRRVTVTCDDTSTRWTDSCDEGGSIAPGGSLQSADAPVYLFAYNRVISNSEPFDFTAMRLYSFKVVGKDGATSVDLKPCRNDKGIVGLYDLARDKFLTNAGSGEFIGGGVLPIGYEALTYIESTGTQYIDSEYRPAAGDAFRCEFSSRLEMQPSVDSAVFGVMTPAGGSRCIFWARRASAGASFREAPVIQYGSDASKGGSAGSLAYGKRISLVCDDESTRWTDEDGGGGTIAPGGALQSSAEPLYIFAYNRVDSDCAREFSSARLYLFKVVDRYGELAVDLVPCRDDEGVAGLYDLARGKFLANKGSGEFYAARETLPEGYEALECIVSTGTQYIDTEYCHRAGDTFSCDFSARLEDLPASHAVFGVMTVAGESRCCFWARRGAASVPVFMYGSGDSVVGQERSFAYGKRVSVVCDDASARWTDAGGGGGTIAPGGSLQSCDAPLYIFAYNRVFAESAPTELAAMRLYSFKVFGKNGDSVVDLVPCRNPEGVAGLYDLARGKFLENKGSGEFYVPGALPEGYMALEYIESTGTQYIDTEYCHSEGDTFDCDFSVRLADQPTVQCAIFGVMTPVQYPRCIFWARRGSAEVPVFMHGTDASVSGMAGSFSYGKRISLVCDDTSARWTDADGGSGSITASGPLKSSDCPLYIFAYNRVDSDCAFEFSATRLYAFKLTDKTGQVVVDLMPCQDPDGVFGLYDLARGKFLTNKGSGEFIGGGVRAEVVEGVLEVSEGMLTSDDVASYDVEKVSAKTVNAGAVQSYPSDLTLTEGVFSLVDGNPETHVVAGELSLAGGVKLVIDLMKRGSDGISADSVVFTGASEENPIVVSPVLRTGSMSRSRIYRIISGAELGEDDLGKFRLEGVEHAVFKIFDGDLCLVHEQWPAGCAILIR